MRWLGLRGVIVVCCLLCCTSCYSPAFRDPKATWWWSWASRDPMYCTAYRPAADAYERCDRRCGSPYWTYSGSRSQYSEYHLARCTCMPGTQELPKNCRKAQIEYVDPEPDYYMYNGVNYHTSDEALQGQHEDHSRILARVPRSPHQNRATLVVLLPIPEQIRTRAFSTTGNPKQSFIDYMAAYFEREYDLMARVLDRRRSFERVVKAQATDPESDRSGADYLLWLELISPRQATWYLRAKAASGREMVSLDFTKGAGFDRILAWAAAVEEKAQKLAGGSSSGR